MLAKVSNKVCTSPVEYAGSLSLIYKQQFSA